MGILSRGFIDLSLFHARARFHALPLMVVQVRRLSCFGQNVILTLLPHLFFGRPFKFLGRLALILPLSQSRVARNVMVTYKPQPVGIVYHKYFYIWHTKI